MIDQQTPQAHLSNPLRGKSAKRFIRYFFVLLIGVLVVGSFGIQLMPFDVFSKIETCLYILAVASPFGLIIYTRLKSRLENYWINKPKFDVAIIFATAFSLVTLMSVLSANMYLDSSLPEKKTFIITGKHIQSHKGHNTYYADIVRPDFVQLPFFFSDKENIHISSYEFQALTVGSAKIEFSYHMGALGIPWYESYNIKGLSTTPTLNVQTLDASPAEIKKNANPPQ